MDGNIREKPEAAPQRSQRPAEPSPPVGSAPAGMGSTRETLPPSAVTGCRREVTARFAAGSETDI